MKKNVQEKRCAACGALLEMGDRFCGECGAPQPAPWTVRVCPACGSQEAGTGGYCGECGAPLYEKKQKKDRSRLRRRVKIALLCLTALCLAFCVTAFVGGGSPDGAVRWTSATVKLLEGKTVPAYNMYEALDTPFAARCRELCVKRAYRKGTEAYGEGDFAAAANLLQITADYGDTWKYKLLIDAHKVNYYYNETSVKNMVASLLEIWDFEDAPAALVANGDIARGWLTGRWETSDGKLHLELSADGSVAYNLPHYFFGDTFRIEDGVMYVYYLTGEEDPTPLFTFYPMSADTVSVYCEADGSYYNLTRVS